MDRMVSLSINDDSQHDNRRELVKLPLEIRELIYGYTITTLTPKEGPHISPLRIKLADRFHPLWPLQFNHNLLKINRQLRTEYAQFLCRKREASFPFAPAMHAIEFKPSRDASGSFNIYTEPSKFMIHQETQIAPFLPFIRGLDIAMRFSVNPSNIFALLPLHLNMLSIKQLLRVLAPVEQLTNMRVHLHLLSSRYDVGWVAREIGRLKAIRGLSFVELKFTKVVNYGTGTQSHHVWAIPAEGDFTKWKHISTEKMGILDETSAGMHADGYDVTCFRCWVDVHYQYLGYDAFGGFLESLDGHCLLRLTSPVQ